MYKRSRTEMEIKMLKTQVCANNVIGKHSAEHPIDVDFTIPDYCGEIERILKCIFIPRINSKSVSGQSVMIDGHVTVRLIYCDKENKIYSFDHLVPFTKFLEINSITADARIKSSVSCSYSNCRAVTQRKVDVHGAIEIKVLIKGEKKSNVVCDVDEKDIPKEYHNFLFLFYCINKYVVIILYHIFPILSIKNRHIIYFFYK